MGDLISKSSVLQVIGLLAVVIFAFHLARGAQTVDVEAICFAILFVILMSQILKYTFAFENKKGMNAVQNGNYQDAIKHFEESYQQFDEKKWMDKWRGLLFMNLSSVGYRETALSNIAFCYSEMGQKDKSSEFYKRVIREFPKSALVKAALKDKKAADEKKDKS